MRVMRLLLFVSSNCPHCPKAEKVANSVAPEYYEHGLTLTRIKTKGSEGKSLALNYDVNATPAMIFVDDDGHVAKRIIGVPSEENLRKDIENLLGLRKSLWQKLGGA